VITRSQLIEAIRYIADTDPDYIYAHMDVLTCTYLPSQGNRCGCLIGEALLYLGVPRALLEQRDQRARAGVGMAWGTENTALVLQAVVERDALFSQWLQHVQQRQDQGWPWFQTVLRADEKAKAEGWVRS
jgi:hypothetical protein